MFKDHAHTSYGGDPGVTFVWQGVRRLAVGVVLSTKLHTSRHAIQSTISEIYSPLLYSV